MQMAARGNQPAAETEVSATATRRRFTTAYKLDVLRRADACKGAGEIGELLRREGLYSSHLANWRGARRRGELSGGERKRGPKPAVVDARDRRIVDLERQLAKANVRAERAEAMVALQKKLAEILGQPLDENGPRR